MTATLQARQSDLAFQASLYTDPNPSRRWLHNSRREWVMDRIIQYTPGPGVRAFEIGPGCGIFTRLMAARGCRIFAVDINVDFLSNVSDIPDIMVSCTDATRHVEAYPRDLVVCSEVLEHVFPDESPGMLRTIRDALAPGGVAIVTTPQATSTMERFVRLLQYRPMMALARRIYGKVDDLGHINVLTARALGEQFRAAGLEVVESTQIALYLPVLAEFGGRFGQKVAAFLERRLRGTTLSGLLWTQAYVLRRAGDA